uniref:Uncharacterized protein n=1 Tax=Ananas comosus var. bracteatus TaxID=296719 RepID=A0A6V7NYG5_ANACO|nr:unnamed protein product [Ananas comosus var. bracteatus]
MLKVPKSLNWNFKISPSIDSPTQIPTIGEILATTDGAVLWGDTRYDPVMTTPELIARGGTTALKPRLIGEYDPILNFKDVKFNPILIYKLREDLSFEEHPVKNLASKVKKLQNHEIPYVKVLWSNHEDHEAT